MNDPVKSSLVAALAVLALGAAILFCAPAPAARPALSASEIAFNNAVAARPVYPAPGLAGFPVP